MIYMLLFLQQSVTYFTTFVVYFTTNIIILLIFNNLLIQFRILFKEIRFQRNRDFQ